MEDLTPEGLEARRKYHRERYKWLKANGILPPDRYDKKKRREYNKRYNELKRQDTDTKRWNKKGEEAKDDK